MSLAIKAARMRTQGAGGLGRQQGGFLSGLLKVAKKVAFGLKPREGVKFIPGVGPIADQALTMVEQIRAERKAMQAQAAIPILPQRSLPARSISSQQVPIPGFIPGIQRFVPGGATGMMDAPSVACPTGWHPNKSDYYTQEGFVPKGSRCVKNRRRNALNPGALTRAVGRVSSAKKANQILGRITIRKKCPCPKK